MILNIQNLTGPLKSIDCILSPWSEWGRLEPDFYQNYNGYSYDDNAYSESNYDNLNTYDYYEDTIVTSDCRCERASDSKTVPKYVLQSRSRSFIKMGTIGGNFCKETTSETRKCVCQIVKT